jgi:hypothetical protein
MHVKTNLGIDFTNAIRTGFHSASEYVRVVNSPLLFRERERMKVKGCWCMREHGAEPYPTLPLQKEKASDTSNTYMGGERIVEKEQEHRCVTSILICSHLT